MSEIILAIAMMCQAGTGNYAIQFAPKVQQTQKECVADFLDCFLGKPKVGSGFPKYSINHSFRRCLRAKK